MLAGLTSNHVTIFFGILFLLFFLNTIHAESAGSYAKSIPLKDQKEIDVRVSTLHD